MRKRTLCSQGAPSLVGRHLRSAVTAVHEGLQRRERGGQVSQEQGHWAVS